MASLLLVTVVLSVRYLVMPNIERYQGEIVSRVAAITGMDVSAKAIRGGWSGFRPFVELEDVVLREPAEATLREAGAEALRLPEVRASLSWWSLFVGQIRFAGATFAGPQLVLSRGKDGLIYFAGRALNQPAGEDDGRLLESLLEQSGVTIRHATLTWNDELAPGQALRFTDVALSLEKHLGGHEIGFVATPPAGLAKDLELRGKVRIGRENGRWKVAGTTYALLHDANLSAIRQHLPLPEALQSGSGNVRAWIDFDNAPAFAAAGAMIAINPIRAITADVNLVNARAQLASDLAPLQIAKLAGRIEYVAEEGGFTVGSKALEFKTREGVTSPPADFSLMLKYQGDAARASGALIANGLDLKVMTALLEYFPVGKEFRALAARFSARGMVEQSSFSWTGPIAKPATYAVKGKLADFGSNANEDTPGISGFTGSMEGNEKGGRFAIKSKNMRFEAPRIFRAPLNFSVLETNGEWKVTPEALEINLGAVKLANEDLSGEFAGRYSRFRADGPRAAEEKGPGTLDIKGRLENIKAIRVADYLPNATAQTREYIEWAARDGEVSSVDFIVKGALYDFPFQHGNGGQFRIDAKVKDIDFRYAEGWPGANDINGVLVFENTRFEAKVESAKIFNAPLKQTTVAIDDFAGSPPVLTIQGTADARAEDAAKYLKESPLIDNVGAFTRFVTLEGPGKLELGLRFLLGSKETAKVKGKYSLFRGRAKILPVGERGIDIVNLGGSVAFTESSVKSTGLAGAAYGNPAAISISGTGDAGITVDATARAAVAQLEDVLPFRMPQQVNGVADFVARIIARGGSTQIAIESDMTGISSTLPAPLAKRADESRKLRVAIANTGQPTEKIRVTLAGNATGGPGTDDPESRIDARFQRRFDARGTARDFQGGVISVGDVTSEATVPDGLWLTGTLPHFDFDAWRAAAGALFPARPGVPQQAAAETAGVSQIAGFDFKLGSLLVYGRPFKAMVLKGRHAKDGWHMNLDSSEADGDFTWRPAAFSDRGMVRARLHHFKLSDEAPTAAPPSVVEPGKEPDYPALDIVAEKFTFKERELGKLELRATPHGINWKIDQLDITNAHTKLETQGLWQRYGDSPDLTGSSRTTMTLKLATSNLNALFEQFGFGDYLKGGSAQLNGQLSWPGHANQFQTAALSGEFKIAARNGRFAKIKPGAGKLLALISLQSIPRRITLDFRDIFSEGFQFDKISGDMKVSSGIMHTDNFEISGTAADIKMVGEISLPAETQKLTMTVVPSLGEGVAIGAGVLLTPAVGAGVLLVQKLLQGAATYEYAVTGSWDNPQVDKISKAPAAAAAGAVEPPKKTP